MLVLAILMAYGFMAYGIGADANAQTIRVANFTPAAATSVKHVMVPWMKAIEKDAAGSVKMHGYWGGSLGRHPAKQFDLVKDGVADISLVLPGYNAGRFPDFSIVELPDLFRDATETSVALTRMFAKGLLGGTADVKVVGLHGNEPYGIHVSKPISSIADLKGLKIRAAGAIQSAYLKRIGAVAIGMPAPGITEAISRRTIDGAMFNWGGLLPFRINNVTTHHYDAAQGASAFLVPMNKARWNKLSAVARKAFDRHGGEAFARLAGEAFDKKAKFVYRMLAKDPKHTIIKPTEQALKTHKAVARAMHADWIKRTADGRRKFDGLIAILADIRAGK